MQHDKTLVFYGRINSVTNSSTYNSTSGTHKAMSSDIKKIDGFSSWMTGLTTAFTAAGWSFYNTGSDLTVNITDYTSNANSLGGGGGLTIAASVAGSTAAAHQYRWVQALDQHDNPLGILPRLTFDNPDDASKPFYETDEEIAPGGGRPEGTFNDGSDRGWPASGHTTEWQAFLFLVDYNAATKRVNLLGGFSYGFQLE